MGIGNYFMNTNVDLFHDSTNNSNGILTSESNEMDLNTLIPVVDNNNHKVVDARLLHAFLQIRRDFTSWIKDRISKYGFIENQDFVLIKYDYLGNLLNDRLPHFGESDTQVVAKTDYLLLMDMAKELCMVENNDKGKKARRYFIEKEKELKKLEKSNNDQVSHLRIPDFSNPAEAARAWADEYEAKVKAEKEAMLALEAKNKVEEEKKIVQAELNTAIDTIKENEPVIDMFKRSIPREGVLIRESSKYFEQFGYYIGIKNMYPLLVVPVPSRWGDPHDLDRRREGTGDGYHPVRTQHFLDYLPHRLIIKSLLVVSCLGYLIRRVGKKQILPSLPYP